MSSASPKQPPTDERGTHFKEHNFDNPIYGAGNLEPTLGKCDTLKGEITIPASGALHGHSCYSVLCVFRP